MVAARRPDCQRALPGLSPRPERSREAHGQAKAPQVGAERFGALEPALRDLRDGILGMTIPRLRPRRGEDGGGADLGDVLVLRVRTGLALAL